MRSLAAEGKALTQTAVLQKHEEEHTERSFTVLLPCLDGYSEPFCDERRPSQAVFFAHSWHLSFPHHILV